MGTCNVRDFGAIEDGHALDTLAINKAVQSCASSGEGTVEVPPGTFLTGTIHLRDHIALHLDAGSVLLGSPDMKDYERLSIGSEGRDTALIVSEDAHDVAITGEDTIDGNGASLIEKDVLHWPSSSTQPGRVAAMRCGNECCRPPKARCREGEAWHSSAECPSIQAPEF